MHFGCHSNNQIAPRLFESFESWVSLYNQFLMALAGLAKPISLLLQFYFAGMEISQLNKCIINPVSAWEQHSEYENRTVKS